MRSDGWPGSGKTSCIVHTRVCKKHSCEPFFLTQPSAAKAAALRKAQGEPVPNSQRHMQTPAELSTLKAEREAQFREKQEAMTRKMMEQQHAALLQRKQANSQPHQQQPLSAAQQ